MTVDPQLQPILDLINSAPPQRWTPDRAPEFRGVFEMLLGTLGEGPTEVTAEDLTYDGPGGTQPLRIYRPLGVEQPAVLVVFHGGGFVIGNINTHDRDCRYLARGSGCAVVSVEYRLAPEHPYPAATDDCFAALHTVAAQGGKWGLDVSRLAVGGDSAGGNLAAVTALRARDAGGPHLDFQLLVYPVVDMTPTMDVHDYESMRENADGYFLTMHDMMFFSDCYLPEGIDRSDPYASPLLAESLADLPPALVMVCGYDPLRDQGEAYARALDDAGVEATLTRYDGGIHGVLGMSAITDIGQRFITEASVAVGEALSG